MNLRVLSTGLLLTIFAPAVCTADVQDDLQGIRKEIQNKKQLLRKTQKVESRVTSELGKIERNLQEKQASLALLVKELDGVETNIDRTGRDIDQTRMMAEAKKKQIDRRLAAMYKGGEMGSLRIFFSSESFPQMAENLRYMKSVLGTDRRLFADYAAQIEKLNTLKQSLEKDAARKEKIKGSIEAKKREIEGEKEKKAGYLTSVRQEKKQYQASIRQLEANSRRLQAMIEKLEAQNRKSYSKQNKQSIGQGYTLPPVPDKGFASQKGRLALPARGDRIAGFGRHKHPEFNSYTVSNGISIAAPAGAEIRSIYDGQVIFADYFKGYGNMVIVDHGGGYFSLYAHASKIFKRVGATVTRNEVLASVGDSDSANGSMLYFEIRYQGKPIDPAAWVR